MQRSEKNKLNNSTLIITMLILKHFLENTSGADPFLWVLWIFLKQLLFRTLFGACFLELVM